LKFIIEYPDVRTIYLHPKTRADYLALYESLFYAIENKDISGIKTIATQLMPFKVEEVRD